MERLYHLPVAALYFSEVCAVPRDLEAQGMDMLSLMIVQPPQRRHTVPVTAWPYS